MLNLYNNFGKIKHITKNALKPVKSGNNKFIQRYVESAKCNVNIWSSCIIELEVKFDRLKYLRNKVKFSRKYKKIELSENGVKFVPNFLELACLRPQLTGCDLLINSPKNSNRVFLYLLPHLLINYYITNYVNRNIAHKLVDFDGDVLKDEDKNKIIKAETLKKVQDLNEGKLVVLLPTIDLAINDSRIAHNCLKRDKKVSFLLYRDIVLDNLEGVLESDVIYSTPKSFLKLLTKFPSLIEKVRNVVVDEGERMVSGEFGYLLVRIRNLLLNDVQFVFLSNFTDNYLLNQFVSRFLKLNFKIISYHNTDVDNNYRDEEDSSTIHNVNNTQNKLIKHIYGPIRSIEKHKSLYNILNRSNTNIENGSPLEIKIKKNRDLILGNVLAQNKKERVYDINYLLYEPNNFVSVLLKELNRDKKTLVYFPTVKMCQFCYVYFKHYLKLFNNPPNSNTNTTKLSSNDLKDSISCVNSNHSNDNPKDNLRNIWEDEFIFYDFHSGLSLSKRRFVLDNFKAIGKGILFCTNLAININFYNVDKIINVSFTFNIPELLSKFFYNYPVVPESNLRNSEPSNCNFNVSYPKNIEKVMLLNNLDGHVLYEYYKNNINLLLLNNDNPCNIEHTNNNNTEDTDDNCREEEKSTATQNVNNNSSNANNNNNYSNNNNNDDECVNNYKDKGDNRIIGGETGRELCDVYLKSSCELMYRSLLGYYSENAKRLKIERWTIPSFLNELVKSFGITETFKVSKQFAVRSQLIDSPGLEISPNFNKKSNLLASLKSSPYFASKSQ